MNREAFLAEIRAHPDDDACRLVFSDWLEENGDPDFAEFIRVQIRLGTLDEDDPARFALEERERALLAAHEAEWLGPLPEPVRSWHFRRGFVEELELHGAVKREEMEHICARHPARDWSFDPAPPLAEWAGHAFLSSIRKLRLPHLPPDAATALKSFLCSADAGRLARLRVQGQRVDDSLAVVLADSPYLESLATLGLDACYLTDAGFDRLLRSPRLPRLAEPELYGAHLTAAAVAALAAPDQAHRWTGLRLHVSASAAGEAPALDPGVFERCVNLRRLRMYGSLWSSFRSPRPPRLPASLTELHMESCPLAGLAAAAPLPSLRRLILDNPALVLDENTQEALSALLTGLNRPALFLKGRLLRNRDLVTLIQRVEGLEHLARIQFNASYQPGGIQALADCPNLTGLQQLTICYLNETCDASLAVLLQSPQLAGLTDLGLWFARFASDAPVRALVNASFPRLRRLGIISPGPNGPALLANWPGLARLESLNLSSTTLGDDAFRPLADSPHLSPLTTVNLGGSPISRALKDAFRARLGSRLVLTHK
jgi:uncharacterized protein (TIGR02996 family)